MGMLAVKMGFFWSVFLAQFGLEDTVGDGIEGLGPERTLVRGLPVTVLEEEEPSAKTLYIDDAVILAIEQGDSKGARQSDHVGPAKTQM